MASLTTLFLSRIYLPFKSTFFTLIVFFFSLWDEYFVVVLLLLVYKSF